MRRQQEIAGIATRLGRWGFTAFEVDRLISISQGLSRAAERWCNENMSETQERRLRVHEAKLEDEARKYAEGHACRCYFQGDPRGAALYILEGEKPDPERRDDSCYSSLGVAVY